MPPFVTTYASASKRGLSGLPFEIPELHFSVSTTYPSTGAPTNAVRIRFITPADGGFSVTWGDGTSVNILPNTDSVITKTYASSATYNIKMTGKGAIKVIDAGRLAYLYSWGTQFLWTDCSDAFKGATNFRNSSVAPDIDYPRFANTLSCSGMFDGCYNWNGNFYKWITTNVTDMSFMFRGCYQFLRDFAGVNFWDVSNVTNMRGMFDGCGYFGFNGGNIVWNWNTVNVTDMSYMFANMFAGWTAQLNWNTSNVTNMEGMFYLSVYSRGDSTGGICNWDVSKVTNMKNMFYRNRNMNSNISNWNTSNVTDMSYMLGSADSTSVHNFNQPIGNWNVSKVTNMEGMFKNSYFEQNINNWNVSAVTNMSSMFNGAYRFNQPLSNWNTINVTNMSYMFSVARNFNQSIQNFDTRSVTNMQGMFKGAENFNQPLGLWNVGAVTNMAEMFSYSPSTGVPMKFNQDLLTWCVSLIPTKPNLFDLNCVDWAQPKPSWGTCSPQPFMAEVTFPAVGQINQYAVAFDVQPNTNLYPVCTVDWGDGSPIQTYSLGNTASHTYPSVSATYTIKVQYTTAMKWRQLKSLTKITHWGTTPLALLEFTGCTNLTTVTSPTPPQLYAPSSSLPCRLEYTFSGCSSLTGGVGFNNWNIPDDTLLTGMFQNASSFNWDLSNWCVPWNDSEPFNFSFNTTAWTLPKPSWGTCGNGPLVKYEFNNTACYSGTGTSINDLTLANNDAVATGVTFSISSGANAGGSFGFNGTKSSYIDASTIPLLTPDPTVTKSYQIWVRFNDVNTLQPIFSKETYTAIPLQRIALRVGFGFVSLGWANIGSNSGTAGSVPVVANTWYLITLVLRTGGVTRLYQNTSLIYNGNDDIPSIPPQLDPSDSRIRIGYSDTTTGGLNGRVGAFLGYNKELSLSDITTYFNSTKTRYGY